jgi:predicted nucleic acid-binding protein
MISVDSSGWIEVITGGTKAGAFSRVIDTHPPAEIVTSTVAIYEVYKKVKRLRGELTALEAVTVLDQTRVIPVDQRIALEAADYSLALGLHFADALVYATARQFEATLYTSDLGFVGVEWVREI